MIEHKVLDEYVDEAYNDFEYKTTHPYVTYDSMVEYFTVDLGEGAYCQVFGLNRFSKAIEIADLIER